GLYLLLILVAELIIPFFHFPKKSEGIYKILLVFTNMGFMGFPIMSAMYGSESLLYASVFMLPFNFLIYTYGIFRLIGGVEKPRVILKKCLNAGVIAVFVTFIIALCNIQLPYIITQSITMLSNLIAPLCMMVIGATFVNVSFREVFCDGKLLIFSVVRLLVIPFVFMFLLRKITDNVLLQNVAFIVIATPAGSMAAMLAQQYDADYRTASKGIALTTLLSVVTMPFMFVVLGLT
ncbi:MAG: AEC family transporter, partial [Lachnospiraceae bacterium]|nr:AEC family transporter [Lachnospiraceae bacterium]